MKTINKNTASEQILELSSGPGSHLQMHNEHRQWISDINSWRDDLVEWQAEIRKLNDELKGLQAIVDRHDHALVAHSESIFNHRQSLATHENLLAQFEQGGTGDQLIQCACGHEEESQKHLQQKVCHEEIKQKQRTLISKWEHLRKAVAASELTEAQ